ncbi:cold shock domain-containing protein [Candidatus Woesearchaeota archaeon]|nr:cold shock domain-containing protein [Candidatus Woesearchaeota archaeon]
MKGTVKFFNHDKGFGFIKADTDEEGNEGKEYFVHKTDLGEGVMLNDNDRVEFEVVEGDRGPKAANVKKDDAA